MGADVDGMKLVIYNDLVLALSQIHPRSPASVDGQRKQGKMWIRGICILSAGDKTSPTFCEEGRRQDGRSNMFARKGLSAMMRSSVIWPTDRARNKVTYHPIKGMLGWSLCMIG